MRTEAEPHATRQQRVQSVSDGDGEHVHGGQRGDGAVEGEHRVPAARPQHAEEGAADGADEEQHSSRILGVEGHVQKLGAHDGHQQAEELDGKGHGAAVHDRLVAAGERHRLHAGQRVERANAETTHGARDVEGGGGIRRQDEVKGRNDAGRAAAAD